MFLNRDSKSYKSYHRRRKKEKLEAYTKINEEYKLGLPEWAIDLEADAYATIRTDALGVFSDVFNGKNILEIMGAVFLLTLTIVVTIVCPPAGTGMGYMIASIVISSSAFVANMTNKVLQYGLFNQKINFISRQIDTTSKATGFAKERTNAAEQSDKITEVIIYDAYAMCANGSLHTFQAPGSQTYSPTIAYDANKGLLGSKQTNQIDEMIMTRGHKNLAGNIGFAQAISQIDIPLAKGELSALSQIDTRENNLRRANTRINEGFSKLAEESFGMYKEGEKVEGYYQMVIQNQITPIQKAIISIDFLDKLKNYNRALRADFDSLHMNDFKQKHLTQEEIDKRLSAYLEWAKEELSKMDIYDMAWLYYDMCLSVMEQFYAEFQEKEIVGIRDGLQKSQRTDDYNQAWDKYGGKNQDVCGTNSRWFELYVTIDSKIYGALKHDNWGFDIAKKTMKLSEVFPEFERLDSMLPSELVGFYERTFIKGFCWMQKNNDAWNHGMYWGFGRIQWVRFAGNWSYQYYAYLQTGDSRASFYLNAFAKPNELEGYDFSLIDEEWKEWG